MVLPGFGDFDLEALGQLIGVAAVSGALALLAYREAILDRVGSILAFLINFVIGYFGDLTWVGLLLLFVLLSFVATKFKFALKRKLKAAEAHGGTRGGLNVLSNGLIPMFVALVWWNGDGPLSQTEATLMYVAAVSAAASDTLASEVGVLDPNVYSILPPHPRVKAGVDGGWSVLGQISAFSAALLVSAIAMVVFDLTHQLDFAFKFLALTTFLGFLGCQIDSVLGATFEKWGWLGKGGVNFCAIGAATILTYWFLGLTGW